MYYLLRTKPRVDGSTPAQRTASRGIVAMLPDNQVAVPTC